MEWKKKKEAKNEEEDIFDMRKVKNKTAPECPIRKGADTEHLPNNSHPKGNDKNGDETAANEFLREFEDKNNKDEIEEFLN